MNTFQAGEELLEYRVVDLSQLFLDTKESENDTSSFFSSFTGGKTNQAFELRGEPKDFLLTLRFFIWLRRFATEICYRRALGDVGTVLCSVYGMGDRIRPHWVQDLGELSQEMMKQLDKQSEKILQMTEEVDVATLWDEVEKKFSPDSLLAFVYMLDSTTEERERVNIKGNVSILPAFFAVNYFTAIQKEFTWDGLDLK